MQKILTPGQKLSMYYKLRHLADAQLTVLQAFRDCEVLCTDLGIQMVSGDLWGQWYDVSRRAIQSLDFLIRVSPEPDDNEPEYWRLWRQGLINGINLHYEELIDTVVRREEP